DTVLLLGKLNGYMTAILPAFLFHNRLDTLPVGWQPKADGVAVEYHAEAERLNIAIFIEVVHDRFGTASGEEPRYFGYRGMGWYFRGIIEQGIIWFIYCTTSSITDVAYLP